MNKQTLQQEALDLATLIHHKHRDSAWDQWYILQELKAELERLDREYNESLDEVESARAGLDYDTVL